MRALKNLVEFFIESEDQLPPCLSTEPRRGASLEAARAKIKNSLNFSASQFLRHFLSKKWQFYFEIVPYANKFFY